MGGSPPQDNSAAIARQQEQERQGRIQQGKGKIDEAFGVFDPAYYDKFKQTYTDYYNPQVDRQYGEARRGLHYNLARSGIEDGTAGQKAFGDLIYDYGNQRQAIAGNALEATNKIRSDVESNKTELYNQNISAADPSLSAISAVGRAGSLQSPQAFNPLGDLFSGAVNAGTAYMAGSSKGLPAAYRGAFAPSAGSTRNSGYVVGG